MTPVKPLYKNRHVQSKSCLEFTSPKGTIQKDFLYTFVDNSGDHLLNYLLTFLTYKVQLFYLNASILTFIFILCFSAGDLCSVHTFPHTRSKGCVPSGSGSANSLQHSGGQDQPGFRLSAGGSCKV